MFDLAVRVAWHDSRWNWTVYRHPAANTFCTLMERIHDSFSLSPDQAKRWLNVQLRDRMAGCRISDADPLANPYRIAELDVDHPDAPAISVGMLDHGLLPDTSFAACHPVPSPSVVASPIDVRRIRAGLVRVLRDAAERADGEALRRPPQLDWAQPCEVGLDYLHAHRGDWGRRHHHAGSPLRCRGGAAPRPPIDEVPGVRGVPSQGAAGAGCSRPFPRSESIGMYSAVLVRRKTRRRIFQFHKCLT